MDILLDFVKCFIVGGFICFIGQLLLNYTKLTSGRILVIFLISGVILQAVGVYQYIVDFAGSGATVPISGFGYLLAKGAMEGARESIFGAISGGLTSGAIGIAFAVIFGYLNAMIFNPKTKNK
ncbi:MAG: SpoVA/SpoVAEb family sporulation membrane protein [Clostridia bacterium]|nr:SpoVA/SpoVAEb family sporulation membrane protein [Clostridia bacterium]MBR2874603.1 SpoVA/SpoVAEb family sporulation membrane protein [Clostridia bacterium]